MVPELAGNVCCSGSMHPVVFVKPSYILHAGYDHCRGDASHLVIARSIALWTWAGQEGAGEDQGQR